MRVHKHGRSLTDGTHRTTGLEEVAFTEPVPWVDLCCYSIYGVDRCRWSVRVQWTLQGGRQVQVPPMVGLSFVGAVELVTEVNKGRQGLSFPISDVYPERLRGGRGYFRRTKLMIIFQMYLGFCRTLGELPSWQPDAYIYIHIYIHIHTCTCLSRVRPHWVLSPLTAYRYFSYNKCSKRSKTFSIRERQERKEKRHS